jgi:4-hydroxythreonine-4-phosphate dehydrogenase
LIETRPILAVTSGEPSGIGPDICLALADRDWSARLVVLGDREVLTERARSLRLSLIVSEFDRAQAVPRGVLPVLHCPAAAPVTPGRLDPRNSCYVISLLERAAAGCLAGEFQAMVTAPLQKSVINDAGIPFIGHTEFLCERCAVPNVVMMLAGGGLRVALASTHLALKDVPGAITIDGLTATLRVLDHDLRHRFGIMRPRIVVSGLNPHSGEGGHMGREEIEVITPVVERLRAEGLDLIGPAPADTLFHPTFLKGVDAVLAMYHDQGLPVLKYASFGEGVNITLGLPIVRTSVDHGTALGIAGKLDATGKPLADPNSLFAAIETALTMTATR